MLDAISLSRCCLYKAAAPGSHYYPSFAQLYPLSICPNLYLTNNLDLDLGMETKPVAQHFGRFPMAAAYASLIENSLNRTRDLWTSRIHYTQKKDFSSIKFSSYIFPTMPTPWCFFLEWTPSRHDPRWILRELGPCPQTRILFPSYFWKTKRTFSAEMASQIKSSDRLLFIRKHIN